MPQMISVIYISTADPALDLDDFEAITDSCRRNNAARDITGLLGYNDLNFIQQIEGPHDAIKELLVEIDKDTRHSGMVILGRRDITAREFPGWDMAAGLYHHEDGSGTNVGELLTRSHASEETRRIFSNFESLGPVRRPHAAKG